MSDLHKKLVEVQFELKAPKGQYNNFGKYSYRNCEDILEAVKPLLKDKGLSIVLSDTPEIIGGRFYIKATATLSDGETTIQTTAYAREEESKKGMDGSQVTGASSSYARKYALNGLFAIDDNKDSDTTNKGNSGENKGNTAVQDKPTKQEQQKEYKCVGCGKLFEPFTSQKGVEYTAGQAYHMIERKYGKALCINCRKKEGLQA